MSIANTPHTGTDSVTCLSSSPPHPMGRHVQRTVAEIRVTTRYAHGNPKPQKGPPWNCTIFTGKAWHDMFCVLCAFSVGGNAVCECGNDLRRSHRWWPVPIRPPRVCQVQVCPESLAQGQGKRRRRQCCVASYALSLFKSAANSIRFRFLSCGVFSKCAPSCSVVVVLCALCFVDVHVSRLSCTLCVDACGRPTRGSLASASSPVSSMPMARASSPRYVRPPLVFGGRSSRVFVCPVMTDLFFSPWCTSRLRDRLQVKWPPRV